MPINENKKRLISNTYDRNNEFEPFILHGKRNKFYCYRVWKWIDGEWLFVVVNTSKEEVLND